MTSEVEERPKLVMAGYCGHGNQWVNEYLSGNSHKKIKPFQNISTKNCYVFVVRIHLSVVGVGEGD